MFIAILEDNAERMVAMRTYLADRFSTFDVVFFAAAEEMISWLETHLSNTIVVSLDHDLEPQVTSAAPSQDPGTGRQVANYIAQRAPQCPVIVHSSNSPAAVGMICELNDAQWVTDRVVPYDDIAWIGEAWFPAIRSAILGQARLLPSSTPAGAAALNAVLVIAPEKTTPTNQPQ